MLIPKQDKPTLQRINLLHPILKAEGLKIYEEAEDALSHYKLRFTYTLRTFQEQELLYSQGRTRPGKVVTNARAGKSYHNFGLSTDICLLSPDGKMATWDTVKDFDGDGKADWMEVVSVFKKYNWTWGGDWKTFKDAPHFEKTFNYTTKQLLDKYKAQDFIPGTKYVNL